MKAPEEMTVRQIMDEIRSIREYITTQANLEHPYAVEKLKRLQTLDATLKEAIRMIGGYAHYEGPATTQNDDINNFQL